MNNVNNECLNVFAFKLLKQQIKFKLCGKTCLTIYPAFNKFIKEFA